MKKCPKCSRMHDADHAHFKQVSKLTDSGFPTHSGQYREAHREANRAEKKKFGEKSFDALEKIAKKAGSHELIGKNTKSGKIEVEKKVPKALREEVAFHEKIENKILRRKK